MVLLKNIFRTTAPSGNSLSYDFSKSHTSKVKFFFLKLAFDVLYLERTALAHWSENKYKMWNFMLIYAGRRVE